MRAPLVAAAVLAAAVSLAVGSTYAAFFSTTATPTNSLSADTLQPASALTSVHTSVTGGMVTVSWTASPSAYTAGYRIDRATAPNGPYTTIATTVSGVNGVTEFGGMAAGSAPDGITAGPDGNLWVTESGANKIAKYSTAGTLLAEYTIPTAASSPKGITSGPDGNLWFVENATNKIGKVTTSGTFTEYTITTANSQPRSITTGPDGNLWFTEQNTTKVAKITTGGTITEYSTGITASSQPYGICSGPDGNVWFTENNGNKIAKITTAGTVTVTEYSIPTAASASRGVAAGPLGNIFYVESAKDKVAKISPAADAPPPSTEYSSGITVASQPTWIAAGPDGNLWFTEVSGNKVARITPGGTVTEYAVTTSSAQPTRIAAGPDGNMWFTENAVDKIGRVGLNLSSSYTDTTAVYGTQYYYRAYAYYRSWTSVTSGDGQALSLAPSSGTDSTPTTPVALSAANLTALSLADTSVFTNATAWATNRMFDTVNVRGAAWPSSSTVYAFGASGHILTSTNGGADWAWQAPAPAKNLDDGTCLSATACWATGASGTIVATTNGTNWSAQTSGTTQELFGVTALDASHVWAVGKAGTIDFYNGSTWTVTTQTSNQLEEVSAVDSTHVWVVGAAGTILFYNGTSWSTQTSGISTDLNGVWFLDANNGWAVGDSGKILKTTNGGTNWTTVSSPAGTTNLETVVFVDSSHGWVSGASGTVLFYNGTSWSAQTPDSAANDCYAMGAYDASHVVLGCDASSNPKFDLQLTTDGGSNWVGLEDQNVEFVFSATPDTGAAISSVQAAISYKTSAAPTTGKFWLIASTDGGATWTYYSLPVGTNASTTTSTVNLSSLVTTSTQLQNLRLRLYISYGSNFKTNDDHVVVQVN